MSERVVLISRLDRQGALCAIDEIANVQSNESSICIDFRTLDRAEPLGMVLFGSAVRRLRFELREQRPELRFRAVGYEGLAYPAHMGLFQLLGIKYGNLPDEAAGGKTYQPIRYISFDEIEKSAAENYTDTHDFLEERCRELAKTLVRRDDDDVVDTLSYCLREIMRNSLEHAQTGGLAYCAQYWPTRDEVEVAIVDDGIGVAQSLKRNPHLTLLNDEAALKLALRPGVSGVAFKGAKQRRNDPWRNSGFGLYMTSQLASEIGEFFVGSGTSGIVLNHKASDVVALRLHGTAVSLRMQPSKMAALKDRLEQLRNDADMNRNESFVNEPLTASMSSQMLARDFESD